MDYKEFLNHFTTFQHLFHSEDMSETYDEIVEDTAHKVFTGIFNEICLNIPGQRRTAKKIEIQKDLPYIKFPHFGIVEELYENCMDYAKSDLSSHLFKWFFKIVATEYFKKTKEETCPLCHEKKPVYFYDFTTNDSNYETICVTSTECCDSCFEKYQSKLSSLLSELNGG